MRYPKSLPAGGVIGVCAPSSGIAPRYHQRLKQAIANVEAMGYTVRVTASVWHQEKCVSADAKTRAAEFMSLYESPEIDTIMPLWGGEFLMDMLPALDFEHLSALPPKWINGYSDITTLLFPLLLRCDMASVHGGAFFAFGYPDLHPSVARLFDFLRGDMPTQHSAPAYGHFADYDRFDLPHYVLDTPSTWKSLSGKAEQFSGRIVGGCLDVMQILAGTPYVDIEPFLAKYREDGFLWTLESCELSAAGLCRALWQMRENGWFKHANGFLIGRAAGYSDTEDFTLRDALADILAPLGVPVVYDADFGHVPPQMMLVNGAYGRVEYKNDKGTLGQEARP